ncbi:MAG: hypothetical protein D6731_24170 [Planctomycetota bacterium]|nr:MAG: hypothetical protein D6731_24170 [Planctomycetota bacterium]
MAHGSSGKVLDTYLRALRRIGELAAEVRLLEEDVAAREVAALRKILAQLQPLLPTLAQPISVREPWSEEAEEHHVAEFGLPVVRSFEETRGHDGLLRHEERTLALLRDGRLVEVRAQGSWREGDPPRDTSWRVLVSSIEVDADFAREHLRAILAGILDLLKEALERGRADRKDLRRRLELLEEVDALLPDEPPEQPLR